MATGFWRALRTRARTERLHPFRWAVLASFAEGLGLALVVPLAALMTDEQGGRMAGVADDVFGMVGLHGQSSQIVGLIGLFWLVLVVRAWVLLRRDQHLAHLQASFVESERLRLMQALGDAQWSDLVRLRHADILQALSGEIARVAAATQAMIQCVVAAILLFAQMLVAMLISPILAMVATLLVAGAGLALGRTLRAAAGHGRQMTGGANALAHNASQLLAGLKQARAQHMQDAFIGAFAVQARLQRELQVDYQVRQGRQRVFATTAIAIFATLILGIGMMLGIPGAVLFGATIVLLRMTGPALSLAQNGLTLAQALPAHAAIDELVAGLVSVPHPVTTAMPRASEPVGVSFDQVSYRYPASESGLQAVSCELPAGARAGLTGPSGAGKTSFVDLLCGLLVPDSGVIRIDGQPLEPATIASWQRSIAYLGQDGFLFNDTVRHNLCWGNDAPGDADMLAALTLVGADALIQRLALGLDSVIGERGALLSGGERQRLALARALLRRPRLLILDEATNAIDPAAEAAMMDRIYRHLPQSTFIMIAHRPESLRSVDFHLRFSGGRVTQCAA